MGVFYLDTSALVKRYVAETGTAWVQAITDPAAQNDIYVAKIAGPEAISAFVRQNPPLPQLAVEYQQVALTDSVIATAMTVAEKHRLRGYDSVQLAAAVELHAARLTATLPPL